MVLAKLVEKNKYSFTRASMIGCIQRVLSGSYGRGRVISSCKNLGLTIKLMSSIQRKVEPL